MNSAALPSLFFDRQLPAEFADLLTGRAVACGPDEADLPTAHAVIAGATYPWDRAAFARARQLRVVSRTGIGYDNVNVADANAASIAVCYAPDAPTVSTAEHTMALLLMVTKRLPSAIDRARHGLPGGPAEGLEVDGATIGLVGFGRIARRVAAAAQGLGMSVIAFDPYVTDPGVAGVRMVDLDELLTSSDVVSLHAPAGAGTHHLIGTATLAKMKRGAYLVNCARGGLVDQEALVIALDSGQLAGAGLDVTDPEPLPVGHPLLTHPAIVVTPHIASSTVAGRRRLYEQAIDNALAFLAGQAPTFVPGSTVR